MEKYRYFIQLAYNGKLYHGWQVQPNAVTVQEELQKGLSLLLREEIQVVGAGRTDTGVHARFFVAHFDVEKSIDQLDKLCFRLNSFLSGSMVVHTIFRCENSFHARFSATSRTYNYFIAQTKSPFSSDFAYRHYTKLDIRKMNEAAQELLDYRDFTSFSRLHTDVKTNNCKVTMAKWEEHGIFLVFTITADRFLRNMVRAVVGTLIMVGEGKISIGEFKTIIEKKDRGSAGASAPAHGLFLTDITYPDEVDRQLKRESNGFFFYP